MAAWCLGAIRKLQRICMYVANYINPYMSLEEMESNY